MQLQIEDLQPEDAQNLGLIEKMPTGKDLWDAEQAYLTDPNQENYLKYLRLRRIEYAWTLYRPRDVRQKERIDARDYLSTTISQAIWGFDNHDITIEYPETWWDAFKNRWFPDWLLKRFPTYWIEWVIDSKTLYPLLEIESPNYTHTLVYNAFRESVVHTNRVETDVTFGKAE